MPGHYHRLAKQCYSRAVIYLCFRQTANTMSKKHQSRPGGLAYSTNKEFFESFGEEEVPQDTLPSEKQRLRVQLDSRQRAGKTVTVVSGFTGTPDDLENLGKRLKTKCGTGGSVKDGLIIIQGDYKTKIISWLQEWGYGNTKG